MSCAEKAVTLGIIIRALRRAYKLEGLVVDEIPRQEDPPILYQNLGMSGHLYPKQKNRGPQYRILWDALNGLRNSIGSYGNDLAECCSLIWVLEIG